MTDDPHAGTRTFLAGGSAYDAFMGRYAVPLAPLLADAAGVSAPMRALDVGCGTGALTGELVTRLGADQVAGCDPAPAQLAACRERFPDVDLRAAPAESLPFDDGAFDVSLAQLVIHFVSDPVRSVGEMRRVVRPGGRVGACVWDFEGGMQLLVSLWEAVVELDAGAPSELILRPFGRAGELGSLFREAGLVDVREEVLAVESRYESFEELWSTVLLGVGPAGAYVTSLDEEGRAALRDAFHARIGLPGGAFSLSATARAVVGTV
ncbi:class I SAM-dependent methyltransferase [Ornithinimicrobium cerasi]|uniref:Ubiquinone/menaquinone biosynthesis C-methylase UbiE n=1 Tax=Ornithinimicrobium cerasi TaxID=2248773 RepID=A0A285VI28_9MICO|nr:class I SAM-dependent methyltransferase [Ornithinimicrobium cerasi]SOC52201.1 Ubiquinone/menaquinone biosynthesis C-methylase UbiE [Ornithinimicrobium cerasi]